MAFHSIKINNNLTSNGKPFFTERGTIMQKYDVAAYVWPAYTGNDARSRIFWEKGNGEWQSVQNAVKKFPEHSWPRKPVWGYVNEADPCVMEMELNVAADHGVNVFIYDWYWYDRQPFLENCLNEGYLQARNNDRVKFYLMWANHSVNPTWDIRNSDAMYDTVIWDGAVDRTEFERIGKRLIQKYFKHPSYYCIDGKPVFQIYDIDNLVRGLGGIHATKEALDWLQEESIRQGLKGIYLQITFWNATCYNLSGVDGGIAPTTSSLVDILGFQGMTHYQFAHYLNINRDYMELIPEAVKEWERIDREFNIPYYPHVSVGWDNNPRFMGFRDGIVKNNTPEAIEAALRAAKQYVDSHPTQVPLVTINSWNEWTETSYIEPDDLYGYGYLEAIKRVFTE